MKKTEPESIGEVLRRAIEENDMQTGLDEAKAVAAWPSIVGKSIAAQTGRPFVDKGVLNITCRSSALRQELNMRRSLLVKLINDAVGSAAISDIRFRT